MLRTEARGYLRDMLRKARIDTTDALHYIIVRGIERRKIFWNDTDRDFLLNPLGHVFNKTHTECYTLGLMPNQVTPLLRTGIATSTTVMRRLLAGCAG